MSADVPILLGIAGPLLAAAYYLWRVQHSIIRPMGQRLSAVERSGEYERQERQVCEWRLGKLAQWWREHDKDEPPPDGLMFGRPSWASKPDPFAGNDVP